MQRILIASGDSSAVELYQSYLWDQGYDAEIATDGIECLVMVREFAPQALLLDEHLPFGGSDGVLSVLAETCPSLALPVILATDSSRNADRMEPYSDLICEILAKPLRLCALADALESAIHRSTRQLQACGSHIGRVHRESPPSVGRDLFIQRLAETRPR